MKRKKKRVHGDSDLPLATKYQSALELLPYA